MSHAMYLGSYVVCVFRIVVVSLDWLSSSAYLLNWSLRGTRAFKRLLFKTGMVRIDIDCRSITFGTVKFQASRMAAAVHYGSITRVFADVIVRHRMIHSDKAKLLTCVSRVLWATGRVAIIPFLWVWADDFASSCGHCHSLTLLNMRIETTLSATKKIDFVGLNAMK